MPRGGKRPGAGRKPGTVEKRTRDKRIVLDEFQQRVMRNMDKLFTAQFAKAVGSIQIFQVVKKGDKFEHELVTDPVIIKEVLDEGEGLNCTTERGFFIVTEIPPETKAQDSMLDRTFGKAAQTVEVKSEGADNWKKAVKLLISNGSAKDIKEAVQMLKDAQFQGLTPEIEDEILSAQVVE